MSASLTYLPVSLALLSISLSTSYLFSLARSQPPQQPQPATDNPGSSSTQARFTPFRPPPSTVDETASVRSGSSTAGPKSPVSTLSDFDFETFTFRLPLPTATSKSSSMPSEGELAADALNEESILRFPSFKMEDAVTLGMNLRKRFRASMRHAKGKGCVISIQTMQGATMFACAVGEGSDVSLDSWWHIEGMIKVVRRTGHSTFYIEKGASAIGKPPDQLGLPFPEYRLDGGAFPIWLQNSSVGPIGIIAIYSGSSTEDHHLVISTLRSYFSKMSASDRGSVAGTERL
ncbi:hypothetical protein FRB90_005933 [Tulasnella sp. 427]|nr:hypothetical protein FRB90_005933 [Tulasnella sp. 427]